MFFFFFIIKLKHQSILGISEDRNPNLLFKHQRLYQLMKSLYQKGDRPCQITINIKNFS